MAEGGTQQHPGLLGKGGICLRSKEEAPKPPGNTWTGQVNPSLSPSSRVTKQVK